VKIRDKNSVHVQFSFSLFTHSSVNLRKTNPGTDHLEEKSQKMYAS